MARDLFAGDGEELLLFCLLYRFGVGERRLGVTDRLRWRLGDIERLFRLYNTQNKAVSKSWN